MKTLWIAVAATLAMGAVADVPRVGLATVDGAIDPITSSYLKRAVHESEAQGFDCLIITLDTPGGLLDSTTAITQTLLSASVPTVAFVYPRGAQAKSAGVFILYSTDLAAMAPATSVGSAHPAILGGGGGAQDQIMLQKLENSTVAQIRALAEQRGRNADWAERAVRKSVSITDAVAVKENVVNTIADSPKDLLIEIDGRKVKTAVGEVTLRTAGAAIIQIQPLWWQRFLHGLANPNVAYVLMLLAIFGIVFELTNPGGIAPAVAGAVALILAVYAFTVLSINVAGVLMIVVAVLLFIADVKFPSHGLLSVGGMVCFALGSYLLFRTSQSFMQISLLLVAAMTVVTAAFFGVIVGAGLLAQRRRIETGAESMLGKVGEARSEITAATGLAFVSGQLWTAHSVSGEIPRGTQVQVVGFDGMVALVRAIDQGGGSASGPTSDV